MTAVLCDGCGRLSGPREAYCVACGRPLPGREVEPSGATPPGWLVASERGQQAPVFEPMPAVPVATADPLTPRPAVWQPGWSVRRPPAAAPARGLPPPPVPLPLPADAEGSGVAEAPRPALRVLYLPLLALVLLSSTAAVALLVLHVLLDR